MSNLEKAKEIVKEYYSVADHGIFNSRNTVRDVMVTIYKGEGLIINVCYDYSYFEVFGLSDAEFEELERYYDSFRRSEEDMTREEEKEAIKVIKEHCYFNNLVPEAKEALDKVIESLEQDSCYDCISRQAVIDLMRSLTRWCVRSEDGKFNNVGLLYDDVMFGIEQLPSVTPKPTMGQCRDCKYFEYDSVAKVDGIPLIVAHEICSKWSDGCKTSENGYCFLFEPLEESEGV